MRYVPPLVADLGNEPDFDCDGGADHYENIYYVVAGAKEFTLYPPTDFPFLYEVRDACLRLMYIWKQIIIDRAHESRIAADVQDRNIHTQQRR
jgi:hypothetical protein